LTQSIQVALKGNDPIYRLSSHVRHTGHVDGGVVLNIDHGQMLRLNQVGSRMLEMLCDGLGEAEIAERIAAVFSTDMDTAAQDVKMFFDQLRQFGVVEERSATATFQCLDVKA